MLASFPFNPCVDDNKFNTVIFYNFYVAVIFKMHGNGWRLLFGGEF